MTGREPGPDGTAVRVALWRALHVEVDDAPSVLHDTIGLALVDPGSGWRLRPDMDPRRSARTRASIVARGRLVDDLAEGAMNEGVDQLVILGAGLDTTAQRRTDLAPRLRIFEVDQPGPQRWKIRRLRTGGYSLPPGLSFVPVDFERTSWRDQVVAAGFDRRRRAVVGSTGVSMYLKAEANRSLLHQVSDLAAGSTFAMTFMMPTDLLDEQDLPGRQSAEQGARAGGTPFLSYYCPQGMLALAKDAGFRSARIASSSDLATRYFAGRADGLNPASAEATLVATT